MDISVWPAAPASGLAAALLALLVGRRVLVRRRVRARARSAGMSLDRLRATGRHRRAEPVRERALRGERHGLPPRVLRAGAGLLVGVGVAVSLEGTFGLLAAVLAAAVCFRSLPDPPSAEQRRAATEVAALRAQLPLTADLLAGCLASWCPPAEAAEAVAGAIGEPMAARLAEVAADLRMGGDAEESWARFGADPVLAPLGRCLVRASASGAPPAAGLARLAEGCRTEAATAAEGRARRAGVLSTAPLGLCFLPAFVLIGVVPVVTGLAGSFLVHT